MPAKSKGVTLRDVAARAGVSIATASVAISGKPSGNCCVSESVAEKIRGIARELRYRPNIYAQRLSRQNSHTIALVIKSSIWHNIMWSIGAMQKTFHEKGYEEIFCMHPNSLEQEARHLERCLEARVKGILIYPLLGMDGKTNAAKVNEISEIERVPVVQLGIALPGCRVPSVVADEQQGVYAAVRHLAELGHKRIAHLTLDGYASASPTSPFLHAHCRYRGYQQAMDEVGLKEHVVTVDPYLSLDPSFEAASDLARKLAETRNGPTAIIAYSDSLSAAAMAGVRQAGLRVPEDVSVVGIDKSAYTDLVRPKLAMVKLPHDALGATGAQMLLNMIDGQAVNSVRLPPPFDPGQTIAPRRGASRGAASTRRNIAQKALSVAGEDR
jgi:DNA-binding LacI/PurR family transcriptional regulator